MASGGGDDDDEFCTTVTARNSPRRVRVTIDRAARAPTAPPLRRRRPTETDPSVGARPRPPPRERRPLEVARRWRAEEEEEGELISGRRLDLAPLRLRAVCNHFEVGQIRWDHQRDPTPAHQLARPGPYSTSLIFYLGAEIRSPKAKATRFSSVRSLARNAPLECQVKIMQNKINISTQNLSRSQRNWRASWTSNWALD